MGLIDKQAQEYKVIEVLKDIDIKCLHLLFDSKLFKINLF